MADVITDFEKQNIIGLIPELKEEVLPIGQLFNTLDNDPTARVSTFYVPGDIDVISGQQAVDNATTGEGGCNSYAVTCATAGAVDVRADFPMIINHLFPDCVELMTTAMVQRQGADAAKKWNNAELVYALSKVVIDSTVVTLAGTTAYDKIEAAIVQLTDQGVSESDINVVVSPAIARELKRSKQECCDLQMFTADKLPLYQNEFDVRLLSKITAGVYNTMASAGAQFDVLAFPYPTSVLKRFCVYEPYFVDIESKDGIGKQTMLKAKEFIGVDNLEERVDGQKYTTWARVGGTAPQTFTE